MVSFYYFKGTFCLCLTGLLALCITSQATDTEAPFISHQMAESITSCKHSGTFPIFIKVLNLPQSVFPWKFFRLWVSTHLFSYDSLPYMPRHWFSNASNVEAFKTQQKAPISLTASCAPSSPPAAKMLMEGLPGDTLSRIIRTSFHRSLTTV